MPILGSSASQSGKIPGSATIDSVTAGDGSVSIAFTEPAYKGKGSITYTATSSPGGFNATSASSPITVTGLTNGTSYTFTVTALTASGVSTSSSASSSVTPAIPTAGFIFGGQAIVSSSYVTISHINKLTYSTETVTTTFDGVATQVGGAGFDNSGTAGYIAGRASVGNGIKKFLFNGETLSTIATTMANSIAKSTYAATQNGNTAGYIGGGYTNFNNNFQVDKLAYSNDSRSTLSNTLDNVMYDAGSYTNGSTAAYMGGGFGFEMGDSRSQINKITFSNDSISTLGQRLDIHRMYGACFSNLGSAGYMAAGVKFDGSLTNEIDKFTFSNETLSNVSSTWYGSLIRGTGHTRISTAGYAAGGEASGSLTNTYAKFTFSNDTRTNLSGQVLGRASYFASAVSNSG
jgi:hypothetical protein